MKYFRAYINENTTFHFDMIDLFNDMFSVRELLIPWLKAENIPCRWTGLIDKKGRPIYENDVVKFYKGGVWHNCTIIFKDGMFSLKWEDGYENPYKLHPNNYEVIGTKFNIKKNGNKNKNYKKN